MRSKFCYFISKYVYSCIYNKKVLKNDHFDNVLGGSSDLIFHLRPCLLGFQINFISLQWFEAFPLPTCQVYSKDSLFRNFEKWILTVYLTGRKVAKINNKLWPFKIGSSDAYLSVPLFRETLIFFIYIGPKLFFEEDMAIWSNNI